MFFRNLLIFVLFFCDSSVKYSLSNQINGSNVARRPSEDKQKAAERQKWLTEIFDEAKYKFSMVDNVTEGCRNDFQLYLQHLSNQSVWAVRMLESSEWPTMSILAGNMVFMGSWFECTLVSAHGINGQFCLVNATYDYDENEDHKIIKYYPHQESSAWNVVKKFQKDKLRLSRQKLKWGICIPSSCSSEDLKNSLNHLLKPIFNKYRIRIQTDVDPALCSKKEKINYPKQFYIFMYCAALYMVMLVLCTVLDSRENTKKKTTLGKQIMESLSLAYNIKRLVRPAPPVQSLAHLIKAVCMCFILFAHLFYHYFEYPKYNVEKIEVGYKEYSTTLTHSGLTDLFLVVSGYLTFDFGIKAVSTGGAFALVLSILLRWIRMTVPLGVIIYLIMYVVPYLGDGPLWKYYVWREAEYCQENWWASIFAVANIFNVERQCLIVSWYISVDLHLALVASFLLFIINKNFKAGVIITIVVFFLGMIITFTVVYVRRLNGVFMFYLSALENPRQSDDFNYQYIATYSRVAPYFTGFLAAIGANLMLKRDLKFPIFFTRIVFFGGFILSEVYQIYSMVFYRSGREYNVLENAIYAATHRWIYVACHAFLLCSASTSRIDKIAAAVAESKLSLIMGRLSFSTFILNMVVLLIYFSLQSNLMPTTHIINVYWSTAAVILIGFLLGFLFYVLVEAPVFNLAKISLKMIYESLHGKLILETEGAILKDEDIGTLKCAVNEGFDPSNERKKASNLNSARSNLSFIAEKNENHKF